MRLQEPLLRQTHFSILEKYQIVSCCKIEHDKILLDNIANFPSKCCANNSTIQFIQSEIPFQLFVIFQAHRDEVITMVANPVVDQVISAGLGEWKPFNLFRQ